MTEWYSHPDARQLDDVIKAQAIIAGNGEPNSSEPDADNVPEVPHDMKGQTVGFHIVKTSGGKTGFNRKFA
jgi:hypothetical protein